MDKFMCCVDNDGYDDCLIDNGEKNECSIASNKKYDNKAQCPFWVNVSEVERIQKGGKIMDLDIVLTSKVLRIVNVKKKTSAKMFKNLEAGDTIVISVPVKHAGSNRGTTYSTYLTIMNTKTLEKTAASFNQITSLLNNFEFVFEFPSI